MEKTECFAWREGAKGWFCSALNVKKCEFPNCKTFKTREECREQKIKCKERIDGYPATYRAYLETKYGKYEIDY